MYKYQLLLTIYIKFINNISGNDIEICPKSWNITCDCEKIGDELLQFYCPQKNNVKINVSLTFDYIKLECDKAMSVKDYEAIPSINLSAIKGYYGFSREKFVIKNCVIPPNGFEDIVGKFNGTIKPDKLFLDESLPFDHKFHREHFNGFVGINRLVVRSTETLTLSLNTFQYVANITMLDVTLPNFRDMNGELFQNQRKLEKLRLRQTPIDFTKELFTNLSSISQLYIEKSVNTLQSNAFELLLHVVDVRMVQNNLTTLPAVLFHSNVHLNTLMIIEPDLKELPHDLLVNLKHLTEFILSSTSIVTIPGDYFEKTNQLTSIDMRDNKLEFLPDRIFRNLNELATINLANNKFTRLSTSLVSELWSLQSLDISRNNLKTYPILVNAPLLEYLDLSHNQIDRFSSADLRFNVPSSIYLTNNNITTIEFSDIQHNLYVSNNKTIELHLDGNPINCDDRLLDFIHHMENPNKLLEFKVVDGECSTPSDLKKHQLSEIYFNDIVHQKSDFCSVYCSRACDCNFRREDKMLVMNCTKEGLSHLDRFPNTTGLGYKYIELLFANQNVTEFPNLSQVPGMETVTVINASNNNIQRFSFETFFINWQRLDLSNNKLVSLDNDLIRSWNESKKLEKLWLSGNPWECSCDTRLMQMFIFSKATRVPNYFEITCANKAGQSLLDIDLCRDRNIAIIVLCLSALFVTLLFTFYYKYRELINVWLYGKFGRSIGQYLSDKPFDAFISYAEPDCNYVFNHIVPALENGPEHYRLCIHTRDWIAAPIMEQIYESVHNSRYTIIVLSGNFLRSTWGVAEFRAAQVQANNERRSNIIMVMYGDVSDDDVENGAKEMQAYLRANTYLKWDDPWFLKKLRYSLRRSRRERRVRRTYDDHAIEMTVQ
ncbi:protein toll-like [Bradysia coprophila]|uniref:protein toll-like n=1 Tax=Bradysia coprophila TaxID=38358 RepID=UPI00187D7685|nr:protein toll-like [Bradysia coprophila]